MSLLLALLACAPSTKPADTAPDTGTSDTSDTGANDTGSTDTGSTDTGSTDTGGNDTSGTDTGGGGGGGAPQYEGGPGDATVATETTRVAGAEVTWYRPTTGGPLPVVILSHGFARGPQHHEGTARQLASWGILVATPALPNFTDHAGNGAFLAEDLLPAAILESGQDDPPVAFVGHSAGGLASLVAASLVGDAVDTYVGLDAVDAAGIGEDVDQDVTAPSLLLHGDGGACNSNANSTGWRTGGAAWHLTIEGATHCDFESDSDGLCTGFCGGEDDARRQLALDYATAWVLDALGVLPAPEWRERGTRAAEDRSAGRISW